MFPFAFVIIIYKLSATQAICITDIGDESLAWIILVFWFEVRLGTKNAVRYMCAFTLLCGYVTIFALILNKLQSFICLRSF